MTGGPTRGVAPPATEPSTTTLKDSDVTLWDRIKDWAVGPGGWLADSDLDEELDAVDQELDAAEARERWCAYWDAMIDDEEAIRDEQVVIVDDEKP